MSQYIEDLEAKVMGYKTKVSEAKRTIARYEESLIKHKQKLALYKKIATDYNTGKYNTYELAEKYDISRATVMRICDCYYAKK